jgi:hypothetical protein
VYDLPGYVWALVLIGVIGIPAATSVMLYRGAVAAGLGRRTAAAVAGATAAGLGGWIAASSLLARAGVYHRGVGLGLVAFAAVLLGLLAATRIPPIGRVLAAPGTPARLAVPHTLRVVGVVFLLVMTLGKLPAVFALPAGLGDLAIGLAAPLVARRLAHGHGQAMAVRFNRLGILDLAVAVTIAFLANLESVGITPSTEPLTLLPLALVATVAVPLAIALHVVSLRRLRLATHPEPGQPGRPFPNAA